MTTRTARPTAPAAARKRNPERVRRAQLVADVVSVLCPWCGEPQPNSDDGSEMWDRQMFMSDQSDSRSHRRGCVSCDGIMLVDADSKAVFA